MISNARRSHGLLLDCLKPSKRQHRLRILCPSTHTLFAVAVLIFFAISLPQWILPTSPPRPNLPPHFPCHDAADGYVLEEMGICTNACGRLCFPRVHGVCFHHTEVTICDGQPPIPKHILEEWGGLPSEMRFYMEKPRMKVPVRHGVCPDWDPSLLRSVKNSRTPAKWVQGLQMVADLTLMPTGRVGPNPHHEAEKVVPAILFSQLTEFKNSSLYWFANPDDPLMISKWSLGLMEVFSRDLKVDYIPPVAKGEPPICFEDAILLAGVTNSGYMPNSDTHDWFRKRILEHCDVPGVNANAPIRDVVIVHRPNSSRNFQNYEAVKQVMEAELRVPVKMAIPGPWTFCKQVKLVAEADVVLTPHGSQNANLLVVRPGATVMEVYPLLYYIDWYKHYLHAGRVSHHELFGTWPSEKRTMPFLMRLYAYVYGWERCFFARHCMNYGKRREIYVDLVELKSLLSMLTSKCRIVVPNSDQCLQKVT